MEHLLHRAPSDLFYRGINTSHMYFWVYPNVVCVTPCKFRLCTFNQQSLLLFSPSPTHHLREILTVHSSAHLSAKQMLKGIKVVTVELRVCRLITLEIIQGIKSMLLHQPRCYHDTIIWAAWDLDFFSFLRSSEFTVPAQSCYDSSIHLLLQDIVIEWRHTQTMTKVYIKQSKTLRQGVDLYLGKTDRDICLVKAIMPYLAICGNQPGPPFMSDNGKMLTCQDVFLYTPGKHHSAVFLTSLSGSQGFLPPWPMYAEAVSVITSYLLVKL